MKQYWSILWRFYLCSVLVSSAYREFIQLSDERYIKINLTILFLCHGLFFLAALRVRKHKFSEEFWRDLYDASALRTIYLTFIGGALSMAVLNVLVAKTFSTDAWVNFKLFGGLSYALLLPAVALGLMRISKRKISAEQLQFATIISAVNLYKEKKTMPVDSEITSAFYSLVSGGGYKLSAEQDNILKLASLVMCRGICRELIEELGKKSELDEKLCAELVRALNHQFVKFV